MLGAIYIGLSGMNAFSQGLQTISNNVANLNTDGFKASTASFTDMFGAGGRGGLTVTGATAAQGGGGVRFADPEIDFGQGTLRQTGGDLDLAVQGNGFLVLKGDKTTLYARTGQFSIDQDGYISLAGTENHLAVLNAANEAVAANVDAKRTIAPAATTVVKFADNLSATATDVRVSSIPVFDSNGGKHIWQVKLTPVGATGPNQWTVAVTDETGATVGTAATLSFIGNIPDPATAKITISSTPLGSSPLLVVLDFSENVTSFSATTSSLRAASSDGSALGSLTTATVDENGQVKLTYDNGKTELLGAVALADFRDPQQLTRVGSGVFEASTSAQGEARLLPSGAAGVGKIVSRQLESSNVNLSQEFGDLILIQRGFQASSQVVSVANDMIQQLFGIRGQ